MRHRAAETGIFMVDSLGSLRWYLKSPAVEYAVQQTDRGSVLWVWSNKIYEYLKVMKLKILPFQKNMGVSTTTLWMGDRLVNCKPPE